MTFSSVLEALMKAYHIDKKDLAKHLDTDEKAVDDWLSEKAVPSYHQLEHLSDMYILPMKTLEKSVEESGCVRIDS